MYVSLNSHLQQDAGEIRTHGQLMEMPSYNISTSWSPAHSHPEWDNKSKFRQTHITFVIFCISNSFYLRVELLKGRIKDQLGHKGNKILYMEWEKSEALKYSIT